MPKKQASTTKKETSSRKKTPNEDKIREKAYYLWLEKGCPQNTAINDWMQAKESLRSPTKRI